MLATRCVQFINVRLTFQDESSREVNIMMSRPILGGPCCFVVMIIGIHNLIFYNARHFSPLFP